MTLEGGRPWPFWLLAGALFLSGLPCASHLTGVRGPADVALLGLGGWAHALFLAAVWTLAGRAASALLGRAGRVLAIALSGPFLLFVAADSWAFGLVGEHLGKNNVGHLFQTESFFTLGLTWIDVTLAVLFCGLGCLLGLSVFRGRPGRFRSAALAAAVGAEVLAVSLGTWARAARAEPWAGLADGAPLLWTPRPARWFASRVDADAEFPSTPRPPSEGRALAAVAPAAGFTRRPDVFLVVVESLRSDALAAMPRVSALAREATVAAAHYGAANCTNLSMFSLLTGLDPSYWSARGTARSPAGLRAFSEAGWDVSFKESMSLNFGLAGKALPHGQADVVPTPPMDPLDRDEANIRWAEAWARAPRARPAFGILFLDASHWPYWIAGDRRVKPDAFYIWEDAAAVAAIRRRYLRSMGEADQRIGRVIDALRQAGRWDGTVFLVTGDHGEAFREHGVLMHGSRLDTEQIRVPLVIHVPGAAPGTLAGPSVHQDVLPTLAAWLGARVPRGPGMGVDLRDGRPRAAPPLVAACGTKIPEGYAALVEGDEVLLELSPAGPSLVGVLGPREEPPSTLQAVLRESFAAATALLAPPG